MAKLMNQLLKNTWAIPVLLATLVLIGLVGALVVEANQDLIYVALVALTIVPVVFAIVNKGSQ